MTDTTKTPGAGKLRVIVRAASLKKMGVRKGAGIGSIGSGTT